MILCKICGCRALWVLNWVPVQPRVKAGLLVNKTIQIYFRRICIITEFSSHRTETRLFLSTNMAAVTSVEKRQFIREKFQFSRDRTAPVRPPLHESKKYEMPLSLYSAKNSMPCRFFITWQMCHSFQSQLTAVKMEHPLACIPWPTVDQVHFSSGSRIFLKESANKQRLFHFII